jgi:DNA-binding NarL/FixJ family response regulator
MADCIRILICDDHPVVRDGLAAMLSTQPDFEVAGTAGTGRAALDLNAALAPDVILLDLQMPELDGVATLRQIRAARPEARVIVFTAYDTDELILGAVQAGAQGYLLKGTPRAELFQAIRVVHAGGSLLQPVVASKLLHHVSAAAAGPAETVPALSTREMEVLRLLGQGQTNKEIARALTISERTVKFHVRSLFAKLGVSNRTEAVTTAAQRGLLKL